MSYAATLVVVLCWVSAFEVGVHATAAPEKLAGFDLYADSSCYTSGGETPDEVVSGAAECAEKCKNAGDCAGFWMNGRTRTDGAHFCRLYRGSWGQMNAPYQGNDCYLRLGLPRQQPRSRSSFDDTNADHKRSRALRRLAFLGTQMPTRRELQSAYRRAALLWHPDRRHNHRRVAEATRRFRLARDAVDLLTLHCAVSSSPRF